MNKYLHTIRIFAVLLTKRYFRDRVALFFTFVFPLIFLLVFGSLNRDSGGLQFKTGIIDYANNDFSQQFTDSVRSLDVVSEKSVHDIDDAKELMGRGELDTILVLPENFAQADTSNNSTGEVLVYFDPGSAQTGQTFASIIDDILIDINQEVTGSVSPFSVSLESIGKEGLNAFDYIFSGLLGFTILSLGFFGPSSAIPSLKKAGVLRRISTTPITTAQYVIANAITYVIAGLLAITLMYVVGVGIFNFQMQGDYVSFTTLVCLGAVLMFGFGLSIGGWAKNESQAAPLSNIIAFPMMFLSGTFFPRFLMPEWLQNVSAFLPLTPLIDGIRLVIVEGNTLLDIGPQVALLLIWIVIIYGIAFKVFRWE